MEKHITLVGILNIVYRSLAIIGSIVLFVIAAGFGFLMEFIERIDHHEMHEIPTELLDIIPIILVVIGVIIFLISVVGIIGAIGVMKKKEWGRITLIVVSFFNLMHVPLGTILGVYSIWVLLNDETIRLFNPIPNAPIEKAAS